MRVISLEWPHAHAVDGVLGGGGRAAGVEPEGGPDDAAVVPEEEGQEDEEVPPLVGVANDVHQAGEEPARNRGSTGLLEGL